MYARARGSCCLGRSGFCSLGCAPPFDRTVLVRTEAVALAPRPSLAVVGADRLRVPANNIYCVGRNYSEHAREMRALGDTSEDEREPPFFFLKPGEALLSHAAGDALDSALVMPYPPQTKVVHYEAELVVCMAEGGHSIPVERALEKVYGYVVGLDMTRRDDQDDAKQNGRPWDAATAFAHSAPCTAVAPAAVLAGGRFEGRIWLQVDGEMKQDSDINCLTWGVARPSPRSPRPSPCSRATSS